MKDSRARSASIYLLFFSVAVTLSLREFVIYWRTPAPSILRSSLVFAFSALAIACMAWRDLRR